MHVGSNFSDTKMDMLPMKEERSWKSKVLMICQEETSEWLERTMANINNGISFIMIKCHQNPRNAR